VAERSPSVYGETLGYADCIPGTKWTHRRTGRLAEIISRSYDRGISWMYLGARRSEYAKSNRTMRSPTVEHFLARFEYLAGS